MITPIEYTLLGQFDIPPGVAQHNRHTRSLAAPPLPRHFTNSPTAGLSSYPVLLPSSIGTSPAVAAAAAAVATAVSTVSKGGSGGDSTQLFAQAAVAHQLAGHWDASGPEIYMFKEAMLLCPVW